MRNHILLLLSLAIIPIIGCNKDSAGKSIDVPEPEAPQPVLLGSNIKTGVTSGTKASVTEWTGAEELFVYSFVTGTADRESLFLDNVKAEASPTTNPEGWVELKRTDEGHVGEPYYYPVNNTTYDFYGYYVGTAKTKDGTGQDIEPTVADNKVTLPIEIDGSQDVMIAKADKAADCAEIGLSPLNAYSAYAARKNVHPNLVFEHLLSRFVFFIKAGDALGKDVKIDSIKMSSLSKGTLTIANVNSDRERGLAGDNTTSSTFKLKDGGTGVNVTDLVPKFNGTPEYQQIGESLMVIPGAGEYTLDIYMHFTVDGQRSGEDFKYSYVLKPSMINPQPTEGTASFQAGYQYNINIAVYGLQKLQVKVTLTEWGNGGTITIDNDNEWPDQPSKGYKMANGKYFYFYYVAEQSTVTVGALVKIWNSVTNEMDKISAGTYQFADSATCGFASVTVDDNSLVSAIEPYSAPAP